MLVKKTLIALGLVGTMLNANAQGLNWEKFPNGDMWETTTARDMGSRGVYFVWLLDQDAFGRHSKMAIMLDCRNAFMRLGRTEVYKHGQLATTLPAEDEVFAIGRGSEFEGKAKIVCARFGIKYENRS